MSLKCLSNFMYVSTNPNVITPLTVDRAAIGPWEKYSIEDAGNGMVAFKAVNGNYVSAPDLGTTTPLIASSATIDESARFRIVDAGGIKVNIIADINNRYISLNGSSQLVASKEVTSTSPLQSTETFEMIFSSPAGTQSFYGTLVGYEAPLCGTRGIWYITLVSSAEADLHGCRCAVPP